MKNFKQLLILSLLAIFGFGQVWGDSYTWTLTSGDLGTNGSPSSSVSKGSPSKTWSASYTWPSGANKYLGWDSNKGVQVGSGSATNKCTKLVLSTTGISGTITNITVNGSHASSGGAAVTIKVGSTTVKSKTNFTTTATDYSTGTISQSGTIEITIDNSASKAFYLKSISVTYTPSGGATAPTITTNPVSANYAVGDNATNLSVAATASSGSLSYQWYSNTANSTTTPTPTALANCTTATYKPSTASAGTTYYFCKVTDSKGSTNSGIAAIKVSEPTGTFNKFTATTLVEGDYVLTYNTYTLANSVSSNRWTNGDAITNGAASLTNPDAAVVWHLSKSGDYWLLYNADAEKYAAGTNTKNQGSMVDMPQGGASNMMKWTATYVATGKWDFENYGRSQASSDSGNKWLRNNGTNGWACYASGTTGALTLYKKALPKHAVTFTAAPMGGTVALSVGGSAISSGAQVEEGATVTVTPTPSANYRIASVTKGGQAITPVQDVYSFTMPSSDVAVAVTFELIPVTAVTLNKSALELVAGATETLSVSSVTPNTARATVTWSSTNTNIATVDSETGLVTAKAAGSATIKATSTVSTSVFGSCALTVTAATGSPVTITQTTGGTVTANVDVADVLEGTSVTLTATPADGYSFSSWTVLDENLDEITPTAQTANTFTFDMPDGEVLAEATFTHETAVLKLHDANGESTYDSGNTHYWKESVTLPSTAAACSKTFMGWSANAECATAPEIAKGASYTIPNKGTNNHLYAVYATDNEDGEVTWTRVTAVNTLTAGGTFILGYEATANSGVIVPMRNNDATATTSDDGLVRSGTTAGSSTAGTITMSSLGTNGGDAYEVAVEAGTVNGTIAIKLASNKYVGKPSSGNKVRLYTEKGVLTNITPELKTNDVIQLKFSSDSSFQYNATSEQERFARYKNSQQNVVFYKKGVGASTYSGYTTTCAAAPTATVDPEEIEATYEAVAAGVIDVTYQNVNLANVSVALFNNEACTEAFSGEWLTASLNNDKDIAYTIAANNSYNDARSAYIKLTAPETNGAADPAIVVIPVSQAKKPAVFANLQELVAADVNANTDVTVSFSNVPIKEIYMYNSNRRGLVFNIQKDAADIKIYFNADVPAAWVAGGKVSGTLTACPWKIYSDAWQLAPASGWAWNNLTYTAPPAIASIEIRGEATNKTYIDGQTFNPAGLSVIAIYDNNDEEDVTEYAEWTYSPATLSEGDTQVTATATYNNKSDGETITGLTVSPIPDKTVAQFIAAGGTRCYLEGIVSNYTNKTKGYFDLTDATGTIYIYGCTSPSSFAAGDKVKVLAETYEYYQSTTHEAKNVEFVSKVSPVAITIEDHNLGTGQNWTIEVTTNPEGADADITYSIKNDGSSAYVTLNDNVVTGIAAGTATLIASIPDGDGYLANSVEFTVTVQFHGTITYEENGGSAVADVADAIALPNPLPTTTREHYAFGGWWTTSNFADGTEAVAGATLTQNAILYAKWTELPKWSYTFTSNVTLVTGGTSTEVAKVKVSGDALQTEYDAIKAGASGNTGTVSVTLPVGTTALHFHAAAWNGKTCTIQLAGLKNPNPTYELTADAGMKNSTPYTLEGDMTGDQYYSVTFNALEEATIVTFSKSSGNDNRFIIYGVNAIYPEITLSPASYDFENVRANQTKQQVFTITPNENVTGTLNASIIDDENGKYSVSSIVNNEVTVTFDPDGAEEGTFTAKLLVEASNASVTANLSGTAIAALAPEITVDKNAVAFGRVNPNASVSESIAVELLHIEGAVSAALSGDDVAKFGLSANSLSENGNIVITPVTTENGIFSATLTLSATGADDVEIPLSITVANKWAVMYTSNVTLTTTGGTSANTAKVKVNGEATQYDAIKAGTGSVYGAVVVTVPAKTQALHLHAAAWKGETVTLNITGASPSSLALTADDGMNSNSPFTLSNSPIGQAFDLTVPYSETATAITFTADNSTNQSGKRFVIYGVNEEGGIHELPAGTTNASTLPEEINLSIGEGSTLNVNSDKRFDNLSVENGGKVTLNSNKLTVVGTFSIEATMGGGKSGQLTGTTASNFEASEAYIDITLGAAGKRNAQWHAFTVPFQVDVINGIYDASTGDKLSNEVNYAIMEYHGDIRATGNYGWKKIRTTLEPGTFYLMTVDGERATYRFKKKAGAALVAGSSKTVYQYPLNGGSTGDNGWNGVGNPTLRYGKVDAVAYVLNPESYEYEDKDPNSTNFVVGTPFFVVATADGSISMGEANASAAYAPRRSPAKGIENIKVAFGNEECTDYLTISASEDALNEYETGKDYLKMMMSSTPKVARIFSKAYGVKLCREFAPMSDDKASYDLTLYVPANGEYVMSAPETEDADVYLTKDGMITWNLSMSECTLELNKGNNEGYGLLLVKKAPQVSTGIENTDVQSTDVQKVVIDNHVFILRGGKMYGVDGKKFK